MTYLFKVNVWAIALVISILVSVASGGGFFSN